MFVNCLGTMADKLEQNTQYMECIRIARREMKIHLVNTNLASHTQQALGSALHISTHIMIIEAVPENTTFGGMTGLQGEIWTPGRNMVVFFSSFCCYIFY